MPRLGRDRTMALGFTALSFALALWQRPGWATSDTKIDLHVDPVAFVGKVASVWAPSIDLGAVQSAQYTGYLWPMGPVFAALHMIGLSPWLAQRIWLGLIFALSAWGVLRLLDILVGRPRGATHLVAAAFYLLNPYTVTFTGRTSATLLGYVALPWLLIVVYHGVRGVRNLRDWRGWWGGAGLLGTLASLWWIVPLLIHVRYGTDFLQFTEQPRSIWGTNSSTEALRLMAYWTSYVGVGFFGASRPFFTEAGTLLFNPLVVGASLLIPALAAASFAWARRWRYAPFLLLLLIVGASIEVAGFPVGTPARHAMEWIYRNILLVRFMRTTQKAAPLVALGVAGLLGIGAQLAWQRLLTLQGPLLRWAALLAAPTVTFGLVALAALPLVRGTAIERQLTWKEIPRAWREAGSGLDRDLPRSSRAVVLPGQIFANYTWGGTIDPILPRVTDRPVAIRYETPYGDPHATDLLWTVDRLVAQQRLLPGQLIPLLRLMGVGAVVSGSDDDIYRSGAAPPASAAAALVGQGLSRPSRAYGPERAVPPARGEIGPSTPLPQVRRYDIRGGPGLVRVAPLGPPTIVDGSAEGLAAMAAFGELTDRRPILYAGDLSTRELGRDAARGAEVVVTDSNRRRRFIPEFGYQNIGPTLAQTEPIGKDFAYIEPFPSKGSKGQTVAALRGAAYLRAPYEGGLLEFPEYGPIAAFDGDPSTVWAADRYYLPSQRWIEVGFNRPRDVPYVDLQPIRDWRGIEREVDVNGVRAKLGPGINRIHLGLRNVSVLRVTLTKVDQPLFTNLRGAGGFREIRIPGVRLRQPLRPPVLAARALAGRDLRRVGLTYLLERTTADGPFQRDRQTGSPLLEVTSNRTDPEKQIDRLVFAPDARSYRPDAWVYPAVDAPDPSLDRLAGWRGPTTFDSSGRFHDQPRYRASRAFDSTGGTAWIGTWARPSDPFPWISWTSGRSRTLSRLRVAPARLPVRRPSLVRLSWAGGATPPLRVGAGGSVALPRPVRARAFRLTVLATRFPTGATDRDRSTRAVGIGSLTVPGMRPVDVPRSGRLRAGCGSVRVRLGGRTVALQPKGTVGDLDAGRPLRARGCSGSVRMGAGVQLIRSLPGVFSVDLLRLRSPAPLPLPRPSGGGEVSDAGRLGHSSVRGVRVRLRGPSWLVLGEGFSKGWQATCDGRSLGPPRPIDGYANGWRAPADCRRVAFSYGPQRAAVAAYVASALVCALLVAFMLVLWLRHRGPRAAPVPPLLPEERPRRLPLPRAAAIALAATIPLCLLFALRTSLVTFPILTLILWRGVGARPLTGVAAGLLGLVVPVVYAVTSPKDTGGFNFEYSLDLIWAHWAGVAALILLMVACWRMLAAAWRHRRPSRPPPSDTSPDRVERDERSLELAGAGRRVE